MTYNGWFEFTEILCFKLCTPVRFVHLLMFLSHMYMCISRQKQTEGVNVPAIIDDHTSRHVTSMTTGHVH